jgi:Tfp pilus assembly protein FimV
VYIRRRLLVLAVLVAVVAAVWLGAGSVRATRGGEPAAPSTGRPAVSSLASYMVQPGDTLWSIASHHHGSADQADYVEALIQRNGGTIVQVGQMLALP